MQCVVWKYIVPWVLLCVACMQGVSISGGSRIFKKRFLVLQKVQLKSYLKSKKKGRNQLLSTFQRHKLNLASSNAPNLSHYACITWKMHSLTSKGAWHNLWEILTSIRLFRFPEIPESPIDLPLSVHVCTIMQFVKMNMRMCFVHLIDTVARKFLQKSTVLC